MKGGRVWGTLFFAFMSFASLSTVIAVFENIVASFMDNFGWERKKSVGVNFVLLLLLSLPCALENNILKGTTMLGGKGILDSLDFLVSNIILPLGSILIVLFSVYSRSWGLKGAMEEINTGRGIKIKNTKALKIYLGVVLPLLILTVGILALL